MIYRVLSKLPKDTILVNGGARGADLIADTIGRDLGFEVRQYPADWTQGRGAGVTRNARMLIKEHPDPAGILIDKGFGFSTNNTNKGTRDMATRLWSCRIRFEILFPV